MQERGLSKRGVRLREGEEEEGSRVPTFAKTAETVAGGTGFSVHGETENDARAPLRGHPFSLPCH